MALGRTLSAVVCLTVSATAAMAQLPTTGLHSVFPPGAKAGTTLDVKITGAHLEGDQRLLFSHSGITASTRMRPPGPLEIGQKVARDEFTVRVADSVPPGSYDVRVQSKYGVSNARTFVVGRLVEVSEDVDNADLESTNHSLEQAIELTLPAVVNGRVDGFVMDRFRFAVTAGERVIVDCAARRIGSTLSAVVTLFDPDERELQRNRGYHGGDALVDFTAPADGEYSVGVRAANFAGQPVQDPKTKKPLPKNHLLFYRLTVSSAPYVDFVFPPSGAPDSNTSFTLFGRNLPGGKPANVRASDGRPLEQLDVRIALPASGLHTDQTVPSHGAPLDGIDHRLNSPAGPSNPVRVSMARAPVIVEQEPNDDEQAQAVRLPCEFVGQFFPRNDQDTVIFQAEKDATYHVEVISNRLGLPVDPSFVVQRLVEKPAVNGENETEADATTEWVDVLVVDDVKHSQFPQRSSAIFTPGGASFLAATYDPWGNFVAPENGTYRVSVRLSDPSRDDPRWVYRLVIRKAVPDFRLATHPWHFGDYSDKTKRSPDRSSVLHRGGTLPLQIVAFRRDGFNGPIEIRTDNLPPGVTAQPVVMGPGVHSVPLVLVAAANAAASTATINVSGRATTDGQQRDQHARAATFAGGRTRLSRDGMRLTVSSEPWPYVVRVGAGRIADTPQGGKLAVPFNLTRHGEFKGAVQVTLFGAPWKPNTFNKPLIGEKKLAIAADATSGALELDVPGNFPPGTYSFFLQAAGTMKFVLKPEQLELAIARQSELQQVLARLETETKAAGDLNSAAQKAATEAATEAKKAADAAQAGTPDDKPGLQKAADEAAANAALLEEKRQAAATRLDAANTLVGDAKAASSAANRLVEEAKKAVVPKDLSFVGLSTPMTITIVPKSEK